MKWIFGALTLCALMCCRMTDDTNEAQSMTFLALGDSYTIGESVGESLRWPVQLANQMSKAGVTINAPQIIATTGWTTNELQDAISDASLEESYDMVSLLIGVNNQFRGYKFSQYEREFVELLDQAIGFAGGDVSKVFVVSIPDYGVTPFGERYEPDKIARELDQYNAYARSKAEEKGVLFFDITPISKEAATQPDLIAEDKLHPSGSMYTRWVEEVILPGLLNK